MNAGACELCSHDGGALIVRTPAWRLVRPDEPLYPATYRLVWGRHEAELSDLVEAEQAQCMAAVARVEAVMRRHLRPHKMNLASLGNVVPHLHWHLIARDERDAHFPRPVWAEPLRAADEGVLARWRAALPALDEALRQAFAARQAGA
jgi:diadenosine tetraphosphate (Ap4A) HIT family hydrolase